jgi:uncharacterized protein with ParB-like and HNH nuclease domain
MQIANGPSSLFALLGETKKISVPDFQRNYSWGSNEIDPFIQDLVTGATSDGEHFFGPIVILDSENERLLVDGQQRITTAVMTIAVLRDYLWTELAEGESHYDDENGYQELKSLVNNLLFDLSFPPQPKFESNYQLAKLFRFGVLENPKSKSRIIFTRAGAGLSPDDTRLSKELRAGFLRIKTQVYNWLETGEVAGERPETPNWATVRTRVLQLRGMLSNGFGIHSMVLTNEADAFILFETLNERGLKLSPADLLKTLIMREVQKHHGKDKLAEVLDDWDATNSNVGDYPFSKFLRHHLLSVMDEPVQMRKVFQLFKAEVSGAKGKALKELSALKNSSIHYRTLLESQPFCRLNAFSETHRLLLLAVYNANTDSKTIKVVTRAVEYLAFRWIVVGLNAQTLENKYQELAKMCGKLNTSEGLNKFLAKIYTLAPNNLDFKIALQSLESEPLQKYLLRRVEEALNGQNPWSDNFTLEHLAPQNPNKPDAEWQKHVPKITVDEVEIDYYKRIAALGNMTLLERGLNSQIQNFAWSIKLNGQSESEGYGGLDASDAALNKALLGIDQWSGDHISRRTEYLVEAGLKLFSEDWVKKGSASVKPYEG